MKNGRRSLKKVSKPLKLTTAGSASTCPKSGFTVAVSVTPGFSAYFRSAPTVAFWSRVDTSGLPVSAGCVFTWPTTYGTSSSRFGVWASFKCVRSPKFETNPFALFEMSGHVSVSLRRPIWRTTANPNVASSDGLKRSCEKGMRNSARQPSLSRETATSQTASQPPSSLPSLDQARSSLTPAGFTPNSKAVRLSWNESTMTFSQSDGESVSRRVRRLTSRCGSGSCARTATYRFEASYATCTSVANVGAAPSLGSR